MRAIILVAAAVALGGCDQRAEILEREYAQAVLPADRCIIARKVADAYLERSSGKKYEEWALLRDIHCGLAQTMRDMQMR